MYRFTPFRDVTSDVTLVMRARCKLQDKANTSCGKNIWSDYAYSNVIRTSTTKPSNVKAVLFFQGTYTVARVFSDITVIHTKSSTSKRSQVFCPACLARVAICMIHKQRYLAHIGRLATIKVYIWLITENRKTIGLSKRYCK